MEVFNVDVKMKNGTELITIQGVIAVSKTDAINQVKRMIVFDAEKTQVKIK